MGRLCLLEAGNLDRERRDLSTHERGEADITGKFGCHRLGVGDDELYDRPHPFEGAGVVAGVLEYQHDVDALDREVVPEGCDELVDVGVCRLEVRLRDEVQRELLDKFFDTVTESGGGPRPDRAEPDVVQVAASHQGGEPEEASVIRIHLDGDQEATEVGIEVSGEAGTGDDRGSIALAHAPCRFLVDRVHEDHEHGSHLEQGGAGRLGGTGALWPVAQGVQDDLASEDSPPVVLRPAKAV